MTHSQVRIIGGRWRGRKIPFAATEGLRPTPDRVRVTLFNWLGQDLTDWNCLDLFAGSGALGFEALSRGARRVVMVEQAPATVRRLEETGRVLDAQGLHVVRADSLRWVMDAPGGYDLIFADPPFSADLYPRLLPLLSRLLRPSGILYAESPDGVPPAPGWSVQKSARAGRVHYQLLGYTSLGGDQPCEREPSTRALSTP